MKVIYSNKMNNLGCLSFKANLFEVNISDYFYPLKDVNQLKEKIYDYDDYYIEGLRIDKYSLGINGSCGLYLQVSFLIGGMWLTNIKREFSNEKFVCTIQYDDGKETERDDMEGFYVKLFTKKGFKGYFEVETVEEAAKKYNFVEYVFIEY